MLTTDAPDAALAEGLHSDVAAVYRDHADLVWRSLQHLGLREADLEDALQEVFVVVQRKLGGFDGRSRLSTWLFGICLRVAARHRRRAYFRFETVSAGADGERVEPTTPEDRFVDGERRRALERALSKLSLEQRAVFVLFELEGESCAAIAELVGIPVGTVYSRLHTARAAVARSLTKAGVLGKDWP